MKLWPFAKQPVTDKKGMQAEAWVASQVEQAGLTILSRNYLCRLGEIDIVAQDQNCLVFIEVRYRKQSTFGSGVESVTQHKQRKIIKAAQWYLQHECQGLEPSCRFDVIGVTGSPPQLDWIPHAFEVPQWN